MRISGTFAGIVVGSMLLLNTGASAVEDNVVNGMVDKGSRGLVNIVTGWYELPMQIVKGYDRGVECVDAPAGSRSLGMLGGLFRGVTHAVGRTGWGVVELATFWASNPTSNAELMPLLDANYAWQEGTCKPVFCPDVQSGVDRIGLRLERGLVGVLAGVAELPGQIRKANAEDRLWIGLPKGLWYTASRIGQGAGDTVLFLLPSPVDNLGIPFEEVEPWDALYGDYYTNVK
jgi:putative exosortase-associated protein (TIGR04073 family)